MDERGTSRLRFLGGAAALAGLAAGAGVNARSARSAGPRSYSAGNFFLVLDGVKTGFLSSVEGGAITGEVIRETSGGSYFIKKHLGQPKYEEFTIDLGLSMAKPVYDWIASSWSTNYQRRNGSILAGDAKLEVQTQRDFFNALITETTIPAADAAAKDVASMTVKFAPEIIRKAKGGGALPAEPKNKEQKQWLPSNFRLAIDGVDCTKVSKVDAFTVKQATAQDGIGDGRDYQPEPGKLEFPNLRIALAESAAESWVTWHEDFVISGNNDESKEKGGSLVFLSPDRQTDLLEVKFYNLGIFKLVPDKVESNSDQIRRVVAELYCERMELVYKGGAA